MNFHEATNGLFDRVTHDDLAKALNVSVAAIRQARLSPNANAHRSPPDDWLPTVIRLAEDRVWHYRKLIEALRAEEGHSK